MIKITKALKRTGFKAKRSRVNRVSAERRDERKEYAKLREQYLADHPLDQIKIALCGFDEKRVLNWARDQTPISASGIYYQGQFIAFSNQIHHRNKCFGDRLLDTRWWISTGNRSHDLVESNKSWSREVGLLLPIQADEEGRWGDRNQALTTKELLDQKTPIPLPS